MDIDPSTAEGMYRTMTSLIVPRPIGWISSRDEAGQDNIAPYSFFNGLNEQNPPVIMYSAEDIEDRQLKDSVSNVLESGEFVHNVVTVDLLEQMDRTAENVNTNEFELAGLTPEEAKTVSVSRVAEAKAHLECTLYDHVRIGDHSIVMGEVEHIHVDDSLLNDENKIDVRKLDPVGRLTGQYYGLIEPIEVERQW